MTDSTVEVVSFDLDALVNAEGAVTSFLYSIALRSGDDAPPPGEAFFAEFVAIRDHQMLLPFRPYKQVMWESLHVWCEQLGYEWIDGYAEAMAMTLRAAQPYPDAARALRRAEESGLVLVLIADTDHDVVCHSLNHLGIGFEEVVISEDVVEKHEPPIVVYTKAAESA